MGSDGARRIRNEPAQKLLPENIVRGIAEGFAHLPAPCAARSEDCGAAVSIALRNEQRQIARPTFKSASTVAPGLGEPGSS